MEIAICDDEKIIREQLRELAQMQDADSSITEYQSGEELLKSRKQFDVSAFQYLLKPVERNKFDEVYKRAFMEVEKRKKQQQKQLFIKTRNRSITLNQRQIIYIENQGKKVLIHTTQEQIEIYASMTELDRQLSDDFYRCHRGYLVNLAHITEYNSDTIWLSAGNQVYLAKDRYNEFVKKYMWYLKNGGTVHA